MWNRLRHLGRDERGMSFVFVGLSCMAFVAATTLAIDLGMVMTARTQAQSAADAGALAGVGALVFDNYDDRSSGGPAVQSAVNTAVTNSVIGAAPSITPSDVTFPVGPGGVSNRVHLVLYRSSDRSNAIPALMGPLFGIPTVNISAAATAETIPANAETCLAPFAIPDKWIERQTPTWDQSDTYSAFPSNPSLQPDVFHPVDMADYTGYNPRVDKGLQLTIHSGTGASVAASLYNGVDLPGSSGSTDYTANLEGCNSAKLHVGDSLTASPSSMVSATNQGIDDLIAKDPSAYWDTTTNKVVSTMNPSPRIKVVPVFDPYYWNVGKQAGHTTADLKISNFIGLFIERRSGNNVVGRITPVTGIIDGASAAPSGAFPKVIRLVE